MKNQLALYLILGLLALSLLALAAACGGDGEGQRTPSPEASPGTPAAEATPGATAPAAIPGTPAAEATLCSEPPPGRDAFENPGFEEGRDPWCILRPPDFILSEDEAHSGSASAYLQMRDNQDSEETKVYYLVQEVTPQEFPDVVSGYYRVDNWVKGTQKQYLQFVVIAFGTDNLIPVCDGARCPNYQIRYILAGIDEEPFEITNAKFVFLTREEPREGEWIFFERNVKDDFRELWGTVPENFQKIRVLFEVRYDKKEPAEDRIEADVYYDDLYLGPPS